MVKSRSFAPLVAAVLVLLPVLYVLSYLLLADHLHVPFTPTAGGGNKFGVLVNYRLGGRAAVKFFWPLEQVDRKLRPKVWNANA
jgi:hypothetical protein